MQDTEHFKVISETDHFALIELNMAAEFNGRQIRAIPTSESLVFLEYLLKTHGLLQIQVKEGYASHSTGKTTTLLICHKQKAQEAELIDKLQRSGAI